MSVDHIGALPTGVFPSSDAVKLSIDGTPVSVARFEHFDDPCHLVHVSLGPGSHGFELMTLRHYQDWFLAPRRLGIEVTHERRKFTFELAGEANLVFWSDGIGYIMIAIDPLLETPQGPEVLRAGEEGLQSDPDEVQTAALQRILDLAGARGVPCTVVIPRGMYRSGSLHLRSNTTLWLESGAVIKASGNPDDLGDPTLAGWDNRRDCFINARGAENIAIRGHGIIDGNRHELARRGYHKSLLKVTNCRQVLVEGVTLTDPCGWNTVFYHCTNVLARRVKIVNNRPRINCINTDGINPDCSSHVRIEHCMMHTGDDAVAVKSSMAGGQGSQASPVQSPADVTDVEITDLVSISNSATCKVGTETTASRMHDIRFRRIDAVRCARAVVIEAFDRAHVHDVTFEDVHVDAFISAGPPARLIEISAPDVNSVWRKNAGLGRISDITVCGVESATAAPCILTGRGGETSISGVRISNVRAGENPVACEKDLLVTGGVASVRIGEQEKPTPSAMHGE